MNKKIFTLLAGAFMLLGSSFMVNAQRSNPYTDKHQAGSVDFYDILTADTIHQLPGTSASTGYDYILSVTGIANGNGALAAQLLNSLQRSSLDSSFVVYMDSSSTNPLQRAALRFETIAKLDTAYNFQYYGSYKFGALRRASWCLHFEQPSAVTGGRVMYQFTNMHNGLNLAAPYDDKYTHASWTADGNGNPMWGDTINAYNPDNQLLNEWQFSHVYKPDQNFQKGMPLYSYVGPNKVAVLVLTTPDATKPQTNYIDVDKNPVDGKATRVSLTGGYAITVKIVDVADLIESATTGVVRTAPGPDGEVPIHNVLLFTLKRANKFVMNADDWNAFSVSGDVNRHIKFEGDANSQVTNSQFSSIKYTNPFTDSDSKYLEAVEVHDSLYHYGYMNFRFPASAKADRQGQYLYVDTAFANNATTMTLAFNWGARRDSTALAASGSLKWGDSFGAPKPDSLDYHVAAGWSANAYWRLDSLIWTIVAEAEAENSVAPGTFMNGSGVIEPTVAGSYTFTANAVAKWDEIVNEAVAAEAQRGLTPGTAPTSAITTITGPVAGTTAITFSAGAPLFSAGNDYLAGNNANYSLSASATVQYQRDSIEFIYAYMKDSIMENQSKFRVVYDPFVDSTFINAYQTRVRYPDLSGSQAVWPHWWENSFWIGDLNAFTNVFLRPSDLFTATIYGHGAVSPATNPLPTAAMNYYLSEISSMTYTTDGLHRISNLGSSGGFEKHGDIANDIYNFHSMMVPFAQSSPNHMDKVMISTADTVSLYLKLHDANYHGFSGLSHIYGVSLTSSGDMMYKDSLFYIDIHNLGGGQILTLDQSFRADGKKGLDTRIRLNYGPRCESDVIVPEKKATIENDLYLIRNARGQYLSVPIWSMSDSVYWVTPKENEDPTQMPCYQWAVVNIENTNGAFQLINREFEKTRYSYVYLEDSDNRQLFKMTGARFNTQELYAKTTEIEDALGIRPVNPYAFPTNIINLEKSDGKGYTLDYSFLRLSDQVKGEYLLGYNYVEPDAAIVDAYAFKYLHGLAIGDNARYISWNGYENEQDTFVYVTGTDEYDKLYFELQEMTKEQSTGVDGHNNGLVLLTEKTVGATSGAAKDLKPLWSSIIERNDRYLAKDSFAIERFGYYTDEIDGLVPLARQAYRLFLKDPYRWHTTVKGNYMTVGTEDRYILASKSYATMEYKGGTSDINGLFGIPHFYFRNSYFDIDGTNTNDDYFALVQRLDTARVDNTLDFDYAGYGARYADIEEYLVKRFGRQAADQIMVHIAANSEHLAFIALVEDASAVLKMAIRGEAANRVSTFQLEIDNDPIYRRFHVNEPKEDFRRHMKDNPDTLEFHLLNQAENGYRLYENSGTYKSDPDEFGQYGSTGGRYYNKVNGEYMKDTLGHVISFLGINLKAQYGDVTNYAIYVDTAFVNRGTGWIKPQYMLVVDPHLTAEENVCDPFTGDSVGANPEYVVGRYLYNTAMYAKQVDAARENFNIVQPVKNMVYRNPNGKSYTYDGWNERLAFSWAIHKGDSLYVLKGVDLEPLYNDNQVNDSRDVWMRLTAEYGSESSYVNFDSLIHKNTKSTYTDAYPIGNDLTVSRTFREFKTVDELVKEGRTIGLHAIIALDDNTHKDWVFSFRYIERKASDFVIESETTDRNNASGAIIRPGYGGWVKFDNGVPMITRSDEKELMAESYQAVFNVHYVGDIYEGDKTKPVDNEDVSSKVTVVGGTGTVTIMNAAGKKVTIVNVLGQTVVNTVVSSENATIAVPTGVVVVSVEGETAVKALVK